jgi:hypothetical protein
LVIFQQKYKLKTPVIRVLTISKIKFPAVLKNIEEIMQTDIALNVRHKLNIGGFIRTRGAHIKNDIKKTDILSGYTQMPRYILKAIIFM